MGMLAFLGAINSYRLGRLKHLEHVKTSLNRDFPIF